MDKIASIEELQERINKTSRQFNHSYFRFGSFSQEEYNKELSEQEKNKQNNYVPAWLA